MEAQLAKRLNLIDVIVLVAATASGLALGRAVVLEDGSGRIDIIAYYTISVALMWSLAILALNLTRYYTTRREVACRPGFSALVAVIVERASEAIFYAFIEGTGSGLMSPSGGTPTSLLDWLWHLLAMNVVQVVRGSSSAGAVTGVWLVTAMAGCWRPEKSWIDRTGRVLGVFWLLAAGIYWLSFLAFPAPVLPASKDPFTP